MRIPDPKANTTTEAYLAYKAGYLEESELKPVLYEPYLHFDAWLAYWAGLTADYPVKNLGKNLFDKDKEKEGRYIDASGSWHSSGPDYINQGYDFDGGDSIAISFSSKVGSPYVRVAEYNGSSFIKRTLVDTSPTSITLDNSTNRVIFSTDENASYFTDLQIEKGSSATSYEPYTGEPEMLCDEEALVAYLSGVTDTYPKEIKDPYDVRIVGYLRHLASIRWPGPDYPVNNEEFYLSTMEPTHTSNSEPSADIELDTAEGKIISVEAYGDTYQQTYSGKNLVRNTFSSPSTVSGVTFTKNPDGTITANGTATEGLSFYPNGNVFYPIAEGTYTLSDGLSSPTSTAYFTHIDTNTSSPNYIYFNTAEGAVTRTIPEGITIKPRIVIRQGQTLDNVVFKLMLEQGSTVTAFEPYVGGIPAPNPDYPQDVQVVTGEQTVKVTGKNLLRLVQVSTPSQGITTTVNSDGSITVSGTASSSWATLTSASTDVALSSGVTYTFSIDKELPVSIGLISSGVTRQDFNIAPSRTSVTATANYDNTALSLYIFGLTQNQSYNFTIYPQFEEGSSVTTYEPFQSQTYTVNLGSIELCKIGSRQDYIYKSGGDWYLHKAVEKIVAEGSVGGYNGTNNWYWIGLSSYGGANAVPSGSLFSDRFKFYKKSDFLATSLVGCSIDSATTLLIRNTDCTSASDYRTWLASNNATFYYPLDTPTDTEITDETLAAQLDALAGADTYNGKTYIKVTATDINLPALLKVEAYKY